MSNCIESTYPRHAFGHARVWCPDIKKQEYHHRLVWAEHNGPIPKGMCIRHTCDNPPCININHLKIGTHKDNMRDMVARGRQRKGIDAGGSKLTEQQVLEIRALQGVKSGVELGLEYGVNKNNIYYIWKRKIWKHI